MVATTKFNAEQNVVPRANDRKSAHHLDGAPVTSVPRTIYLKSDQTASVPKINGTQSTVPKEAEKGKFPANIDANVARCG